MEWDDEIPRFQDRPPCRMSDPYRHSTCCPTCIAKAQASRARRVAMEQSMRKLIDRGEDGRTTVTKIKPKIVPMECGGSVLATASGGSLDVCLQVTESRVNNIPQGYATVYMTIATARELIEQLEGAIERAEKNTGPRTTKRVSARRKPQVGA